MRGYTVVEIPTNDDRERKRERGERLTKGRLFQIACFLPLLVILH